MNEVFVVAITEVLLDVYHAKLTTPVRKSYWEQKTPFREKSEADKGGISGVPVTGQDLAFRDQV